MVTNFNFPGSIIAKPNRTPLESIYEIIINDITGTEKKLSDLKGKKILIVNVASRCGYTSQYKDLQSFYSTHSDKIEIIGIPCNDFGWQEPSGNSEILDFCTTNYNVTFPIMSKTNIKSNPKHPLYTWLTSPEKNGWNSKEPSWNFCKYLISENGELLGFYKSGILPHEIEFLKQL